LGPKQAQEDPWLRIGETYPVGTDLRGRVLRLMDKGVVVDFGQDIEGFVTMSQLGIPDISNPADAVKEGQAVELKVLEVDPIHHRIVLAATGWPKEDGTQEAAKQESQGQTARRVDGERVVGRRGQSFLTPFFLAPALRLPVYPSSRLDFPL